MNRAPVVLFDGVCNLCSGAVTFVLDHEAQGDAHDRGALTTAYGLRFAALQSEAARTLLSECKADGEARALRAAADGGGDPDTIAFVEDGRVYVRSTAALRIARHLRAPWSWLRFFIVVPRPIRDFVYRFIARHRYDWFGKSDTCRVPTPNLRARFLE